MLFHVGHFGRLIYFGVHSPDVTLLADAETLVFPLHVGPVLASKWSVCHLNRRQNMIVPGKTKRRFCLFSAYFPPMVPHPPFFHPHVYGIHLFPPIFCLFSAYFLPHPCYKLAVFPPTCLWILPIFHLYSPHFLPIFRLTFFLFSAGPVLPGRFTSTQDWSFFFKKQIALIRFIQFIE